jgi:thiamine biosynthesis lipoprotein
MTLVARYDKSSCQGQTTLFALWRSFAILVSLFLIGCSNKPEIIEISGSKMGTSYHITVVADQLPPDDLAQQIDQLLSVVDNSMSTYKQNSEISQFNRLPAGGSLEISSEFADVIRISQKVWTLSEGAFDPTIGPLVDLWGFGATHSEQSVPSAQSIQQALDNVGFESVVLEGLTLTKQKALALDLSAVAKGYGVDLVADHLEMLALPDYLVEIGGEIRVSGFNADEVAWKIALEQPQLFAAVDRVIDLTDIAVATSGDYRNYFEKEGQRYSHTIDPRSGRPIKHSLASVTVITKSCAEADAWATAFSVMGASQSKDIANQLGIAAYMLVRQDDDFVAITSDNFAPFIN